MSEEITLQELLDKYLVDLSIDWTGAKTIENLGDLSVDTTGDLRLTIGLKVIENDIRARLLTRKKTIIDGITYPAETSEENFGSSLYYLIGRKKTPSNIRLAMVYVTEALLDCPYLTIDRIDAEVFSSKDLNNEMVKLIINATVIFPAEGFAVEGLNEKVKVEVSY